MRGEGFLIDKGINNLHEQLCESKLKCKLHILRMYSPI